MRRALVAAVAIATIAGCSLGAGTPYPGAATRYREFIRCSSVQGNWCYGPHRASETTGGGRHGVVAGMRMGSEGGDLGATTGGGIAFDVRGEYSYAVTSWASIGATVAAQLVAGELADGATSFGAIRTPAGAQVTVSPTPPLLLRAGGFIAPGRVELGDTLESSTTTRGWFVGGGMSIPFPGIHLVLTFEWHRHTTPDVMTPAGMVTYDADTYLFGYWLVL